MELNELANKMSILAFSDNDVSYSKLQELTNLNVAFAPNANIYVCFADCKNALFREYFYYKAFLVSFYVHTVFSSQIQMNEMNKLVELYMNELQIAFNNNKTGFGNSFDTFVNRYNTYFDIALRHLNDKHRLFMADEMNNFCVSNLGFNRESALFAVGVLNNTVFNPLHKDVLTEVNKFNSSSKCFVATATYQNAMHPNVVLLRDYRDRFLRKSIFGRLFISAYYRIGPTLSYFPENYKVIRELSKRVIDKIVLMIKAMYY